MKITALPISAVTPDPANVRLHDDRNLDAIRGSLTRFGQQKPIVVDAKGVIRAGNGTYLAAKSLGWETIEVVHTGLEGADATAFSIADNRTSDLSTFDDESLASLLKALQLEDSLDGVGFAEEEINELQASLAASEAVLNEDPGPEPPSPIAASRRGDLWLLGSHRLLNGDSTSAEDMQRLLGKDQVALLATDPPYCVNYTGIDRPIHEGKPSGKDWSSVYREIDIADLGEFLDKVLTVVLPRLRKKAPVYMWHAHVQQPTVAAAFERHGLLLHQVLVWVKPTAVFGHSYFRWRHEPCAFGWKKGDKPDHGVAQLDTVWECDWEGKARPVDLGHPTSKPTRLFEIPIELHTKAGEIVLEPFSGSGSQLVAAEKLGRKCRAMEITPAFVDVAIKRWQKLTGKAATLDGDGRTFDELSAERLGAQEPAP